jgi:thiamine-phosphate pyrophosphorylase
VSILSNSPSNRPAGRKAPILCYVTDRRSFAHSPQSRDDLSRLTAKIAELAAASIDWIQIREKDLTGKQLSLLVRDALREVRAVPIAPERAGERASERFSSRICVNDRVDVALSENAGGAHLGENGLPVQQAARFVKRLKVPVNSRAEFLLGASCHSIEGARAVAADGADYIFFGPIFATPSKAQFGPPQGVANLAEVCRAVSIPVVAIGGITPESTGACLAAGAAGIAAIRLFQDSLDPAALIRSLHAMRR